MNKLYNLISKFIIRHERDIDIALAAFIVIAIFYFFVFQFARS